MSDYLNRVDAIQDTSSGTTNLSSYTYLGLGTVVRIAYPQPSVWLDLWGGTSGTFAGLDLFNRIIDQRWQNSTGGTPTDIDRYQYGYDQDSNRIWKANTMTTGLDEFYTYDPLNRLTEMQRGTLNGTKTGITGTPVKEQDWTLDPTGNWSNFVDKVSGTTDLNQTRTANKVNEITNLTESTGPTWVVPAYDQAGNMTTMPQPASPTNSYTAVYDAWNRMVSISDASNLVGQYKYDGRNFRTVKLSYASGVLTETRHVFFTNSWQDIEERVGTSTTRDKQYVWGVRYIDELVCRDDATPRRLNVTQDANFNVTALVSTAGAAQQRFVYDPYGNALTMSSGFSPATDIFSWEPRFTGRSYDAGTGLHGYRFRDYLSSLGVFTSRDPLNLRRRSLFEYVNSTPQLMVDPFGLDGSWQDTPGYQAILQAQQRERDRLEEELLKRHAERDFTPTTSATGCSVRTVCHQSPHGSLRHCGLYVYQAGQGTQAVDGYGPIDTVFVGFILLDAVLKYGFDPSKIWIRPAFPVDWHYRKTHPNDPDWNWETIDKHGDRWDDPKATYGPWSDFSPDYCRCLTDQNRAAAYQRNNTERYHMFGTNSNWSLNCWLKSCGLTIQYPAGDVPIGTDDPAKCPKC